MTTDNFTARLAQKKLATKTDVDDLAQERDSEHKLKHLNKKVTLNKRKHVKTEKKLTDLTKESEQISEKIWFLVRQNAFYRRLWLWEFFSFSPNA